MMHRSLIRGHVVEVDDEHRLFVDGTDMTADFEGELLDSDVLYSAVCLYEERQ